MKIGSILFVFFCLFLSLICVNSEASFSPVDPNISVIGRYQIVTNSKTRIPNLQYGWSAVRLVVSFSGSSKISFKLTDKGNRHAIYVDGKQIDMLLFPSNAVSTITKTIDKLDPSVSHSVQLFRLTESFYGVTQLEEITLDNGGKLIPSVLEIDCKHGKPNASNAGVSWPYATCKNRRIEFIGDSITCGYGNGQIGPCDPTNLNELSNQAWGYLTGSKLFAQTHINCWSGIGAVRNYGSDYQMSPNVMFNAYWPNALAGAGYSWNFDSWVPRAVVINLGTNDFSGGDLSPTKEQYVTKYLALMRDAKAKYQSNPGLQFFLGCGPMSKKYCPFLSDIRSQAASLGMNATQINLQVFNGDKNLVGCAGHPSVAGHALMAQRAAFTIKNAFNWN